MEITQVKLHQLLRKPLLSKQEKQQIVNILRRGAYDMPDVSFQYAYELLKNNLNENEKYLNLDEAMNAGIQLKIKPSIIKNYLKYFMNQIGKVQYLLKLNTFINFIYSSNTSKQQLILQLKQNLIDTKTKKKLLTILKKQGNIDDYVKGINHFLDQNPNDLQAWIELANIYIQHGQYLRALFCYEEIIILVPNNNHYFVKLAQLYYTLGGKDKLSNAVKYYSFVIKKQPTHLRALLGLHRCLHTLGIKNITQQEKKLQQKCQIMINHLYNKKNSLIKIHYIF